MAAVLVPDMSWRLIEPLLPIRLPKPRRRPTARDSPGLSRRYRFRAPKWNSLADAAERAGVRLRHDLLAAFARLAGGRNLGFDPFLIGKLAFT